MFSELTRYSLFLFSRRKLRENKALKIKKYKIIPVHHINLVAAKGSFESSECEGIEFSMREKIFSSNVQEIPPTYWTSFSDIKSSRSLKMMCTPLRSIKKKRCLAGFWKNNSIVKLSLPSTTFHQHVSAFKLNSI